MDQNPGRQIVPVQLLRRVPVPEAGEQLRQTIAPGLPPPMLGVVVPISEDHGVVPLLTPVAVILPLPLLLVLALTPAAVVTFSTLPPSPFAWLAAGVGEGKLGAVETLPLGEWLMRRLPLAPDLTDFSSVAMEKVLDEQPLLFRSPRCQRPASLVPMTARVGWHLADQIGGSWFCHLPEAEVPPVCPAVPPEAGPSSTM